MPSFPDHDDYVAWVALLADPIRSQRAFWHLVLSGSAALDSVRRGLDSSNGDVRRLATRAMDHLADGDSLSTLTRMLDDPYQHVRAYAIELVGRWVHTHPEAEAAIIRARDHDTAPAVRKKAGWYAPGGTIHRKTARAVSKRVARTG